jgi:hypothetical protein
MHPTHTPQPTCKVHPPLKVVGVTCHNRDDGPVVAGGQQQSGHHTRKGPAVAEPCLGPVQVLVHDSRCPACTDVGAFCPEQWRQRPHFKTLALTLDPAPDPVPAPAPKPLPGTTPLVTPLRCGPPGPRGRRQLRPMTAPPDREDGPSHLLALIIDMTTMSCRRTMLQTAMAQHGRISTGGRRRRSCAAAAAAGAGVGGVVTRGAGGITSLNATPHRGAGVLLDTMDDKQMSTKDGVL